MNQLLPCRIRAEREDANERINPVLFVIELKERKIPLMPPGLPQPPVPQSGPEKPRLAAEAADGVAAPAGFAFVK